MATPIEFACMIKAGYFMVQSRMNEHTYYGYIANVSSIKLIL